MTFAIAAALALAVQTSPAPAIQTSPAPQSQPAQSNLEYSMPIAGNWTYATTANGSEATFSNESSAPQLTIRCSRSTRRVALLKAASSAAPSMWVWTSSDKKTLPATYDSTAGRVSAELGAYDPLLDAMASSRGRIGVSTFGLAALVVPPWAEVGRVIEDCRV